MEFNILRIFFPSLGSARGLAYLLGLMAILASSFLILNQGVQPQVLILHLLSTLGCALLVKFTHTYFSGLKKDTWNTVITGLILFLLINPASGTSETLLAILATLLAMFFKLYLVRRGFPIFNPAAAGLFVTGLLAYVTGEYIFVSWWGASFAGAISLSLLLIWCLSALFKWGKAYAAGMFLSANAILLILRDQGFEMLSFVYTDATIYFLAGIMLVDPKSSPFKKKHQLAFGLAAALAYNLALERHMAAAPLIAILAANLVWLLLRPAKKAATKPMPSVVSSKPL